ncbi:SRPBCC domain-containing protein [Amycolatopsis sp. NBC_01488]|uniref:SRPBCC family protein n=1 Tax=Amycolatopsis sp. NBC_01488 TaxID=2903563 RepID=UPI002E2E05C1|nr:SRPBCC domain-containing protein [Amycolatopsis sp. NBC_01488]
MIEALEVTVHIEAPPETVFPYFTDPARYTQWMGGTAMLEPVPGGGYRVGMRGGVAAVGEFVEIDPPRRIVFTWGWTHDHAVAPGSTRVVVTLEPVDGGTLVVLRHHGLPGDEQREHHGKGWTMYLDRLAVRATGGDPGPDPNI